MIKPLLFNQGSPVELTDSHLEKNIDVWNRKSRRIVCSLGKLDTM